MTKTTSLSVDEQSRLARLQRELGWHNAELGFEQSLGKIVGFEMIRDSRCLILG